ncbi:MAG: peptide/nickel transport system permease protein, partial [Actinomycetota bacterium]|nr:peptide/nickel transport system permease protein [Actinomycetota bacterium]
LSFAPGDPAVTLAGPHATPGQLQALREQLGEDRPLPIRYASWLGSVLHGDFGQSTQFRQSVSSLLEPRVGVTVLLVTYAFLLILLFGLGLGLLPSVSRYLTWPVVVVSSLGVAIPTFVAALLLIEIFALRLGWFPVLGSSSGGPLNRLWHLTLPAIALALSWAAFVAQISRAAIREEESREHVETARSRGLGGGLIFRKHILRNAAVPIVTVVGLTLAGLVAGSIVVETAFGIGGIGSFLVVSVSAKDTNVVLAISIVFVVAFVVVTTIADIAQILLDPRVRDRVTS